MIHLHGDLAAIGCGMLLLIVFGFLFLGGLLEAAPCCGIAVLVFLVLAGMSAMSSG